MRRAAGLALVMVLVSLLLAPGRALADMSPEELQVLAELFTLNRTLEQIQGQMADLDGQITVAATRQAELQAERDRLEAQRQTRQAQFGRRVRYYHERGSLGPLQFVMGAQDFTEFLIRVEAVVAVLRRDAEVMAELRSLKAAVEAKEQAVAAVRAELTQLREKLAGQEAALRLEVAKKEEILVGLKEQRERMERELAEVDRVWTTTARPVLLALGKSLEAVNLSEFEPDQVSLAFFPPGAQVRIGQENLNGFFGKRAELQGLTFRLQQGKAGLEGQFGDSPLRIYGTFGIRAKTVLRYSPQEIKIKEFVVPEGTIKEIVEHGMLDIDLGTLIKPWSLQEVRLEEGYLFLKTGIR